MTQTDAIAALREDFARYAERWPAEATAVARFVALAGEAPDPFVRERSAGHFTASALVVSGDGRRTLLTHHRKLGLWLQPGGHADGDRDLARVALREAKEETGLRELRLEGGILDLDRHRIPEHRGVPEHWHYDVRYLVRAGAHEQFAVSDESHALAWRDIQEVANDPSLDRSLRRMVGKWLGADAR
ncbi:NUDIX hydrolase [Luteimonas sp. RD2P54]|uniref:NUDIX hydrolase n=1 Tax=Luteimonas endophytica TaxID=3042023 RepID=A0ABT6J424_9GAMM|nr:NUDIX hydrolase [Luteimonas endophytica]MDH5821524.1 NUDIX hydrolase [Luteimonas endophytica]